MAFQTWLLEVRRRLRDQKWTVIGHRIDLRFRVAPLALRRVLRRRVEHKLTDLDVNERQIILLDVGMALLAAVVCVVVGIDVALATANRLVGRARVDWKVATVFDRAVDVSGGMTKQTTRTRINVVRDGRVVGIGFGALMTSRTRFACKIGRPRFVVS